MQVRALIYYSLKQVSQSWKTLLLVFLGPMLIISGLGILLTPLTSEGSVTETFEMAIVNQDPTVETRAIIQHFERSQSLKKLTRIHHVNEQEAYQLLQENRIAALIKIPPGFSDDLTHGVNTPVEVIGNPRRPLQAQLVKKLMASSADLVSAAQSGVNTVYHFLQEANVSRERMKETFNQSVIEFSFHALGRHELFKMETVSATGVLAPRYYYTLSACIILFMIWGLLSVGLVTSENQQALRQRLVTLGLKPYQIYIAHFLSVALLLFIFMLPVFIFVFTYFKDEFYISWTVLSISIMLMGLTISAIMTMLQMIVERPIGVSFIGLLLILWFAFTGGGILPLVYLPSWVDMASLISFQYWTHQLLVEGLWSVGLGTFQPLGILILMLITTVCMGIGAAKVRGTS